MSLPLPADLPVRPGHRLVLHEPGHRLDLIVHADRDERESVRRHLCDQLPQVRHHIDARLAPGRPEVEQHDPPTVVRQRLLHAVQPRPGHPRRQRSADGSVSDAANQIGLGLSKGRHVRPPPNRETLLSQRQRSVLLPHPEPLDVRRRSRLCWQPVLRVSRSLRSGRGAGRPLVGRHGLAASRHAGHSAAERCDPPVPYGLHSQSASVRPPRSSARRRGAPGPRPPTPPLRATLRSRASTTRR